jgi:hypothetical protein
MNEFTNTQIISGLLAIVAATYAAIFARMVRRFDRLEERFDTRIDKLDEKFSGELRSVYAKLDALTIAVPRLEGAVWHTPPERLPPASSPDRPNALLRRGRRPVGYQRAPAIYFSVSKEISVLPERFVAPGLTERSTSHIIGCSRKGVISAKNRLQQ